MQLVPMCNNNRVYNSSVQCNNNVLFKSKMGNAIQSRKFKIKNKTEFPVFIQLSDARLCLDVTNIRPGTTVRFSIVH